jgi:hypothetical protein
MWSTQHWKALPGTPAQAQAERSAHRAGPAPTQQGARGVAPSSSPSMAKTVPSAATPRPRSRVAALLFLPLAQPR